MLNLASGEEAVPFAGKKNMKMIIDEQSVKDWAEIMNLNPNMLSSELMSGTEKE